MVNNIMDDRLFGLAQKPELGLNRRLKAGAVLMREYQGERHTVTVVPDGFVWREVTYPSLSALARAITGIPPGMVTGSSVCAKPKPM